jgi:YVTN family beta-propeller protein
MSNDRHVFIRYLKEKKMSRITLIIGGTALLISLAALICGVGVEGQSAAFSNFEGSQTNPIRLSPDGTRLFAVNTPNASLSVFDVTQPGNPTLITQIPVGVEPVSVNPRSDDEAWVVNQVSNSVSVVSVSKGIVTDTIRVGTEPMDVVFAGPNQSQAYVSESRTDSVGVFDTGTHASIKTILLVGANPRALAASPDGSKVYTAFAFSGNATTIIPDTLAPPQSPPTNPALPAPPQVGLIVSATDPAWSSRVTYRMPDNDVAVISTGSTPFVSGYYSGVGTINLGIAVNPQTNDLFVANTDALNLTHFETNLHGHWVNNRITRIQAANGQVTPFDLNPGINYAILPNPAALAIALAQPTAVVFDPSGQFMYVAAYGTDRVALVDTNGNVLSFIEIAPPSGAGSNVDPDTKRGPRGLALNASAHVLYVMNRITDTISVVNTQQNDVSSEIAVGPDPTPLAVKAGRGFLYDAKLSGSGTGSCASCHVDGDMDHIAWDLGDPGASLTTVTQGSQTITFHPMKGPMTTQSMRGLLNLTPYHWRGDKQNLAAFNGAFSALMGGNQISTSDMGLFTLFTNTIQYLPNPNQNLDRSLPSSFRGGNPIAGQNDFLTVEESQFGTGNLTTCNFCHTANPGPGTNRAIIGQDKPQPLKTPQLRNVYQKQLFNRFGNVSVDGFGMDHDGSVSTFLDFFASATFAGYTSTQKKDMAAYMLCFDTGTAPAVGYTITLTSQNVSSQQNQSDWATLQQQALAANIDLIGEGTINGQLHGLLFQPSSGNYVADTSALGPFTQSQLQSLIQAGDTLSFMGVYPGTGSTNSVRTLRSKRR